MSTRAELQRICRENPRLHTTLHRCGKSRPMPRRCPAFHGFFGPADLWTTAGEAVRLYSPAAGIRWPKSLFSDDHETDLSAERTQTEAQAWLPCAHVDAGRSPDPQAPPREGSQAPLGVQPVQRRNRLSRSRDFDAVYRHGRSVSTRFLTLYWFQRDEAHRRPAPRVRRAEGGRQRRRPESDQAAAAGDRPRPARGRARDERLRARRPRRACPRPPRRTATPGSPARVDEVLGKAAA